MPVPSTALSFCRHLTTRWGVLMLALLVTACAGGRFDTPYASGHYESQPVQCVPYARQMSGVNIRGDAWTWWNQAPPRYGLGQRPERGAVLVLAQTPKLAYGHLAVVKDVVGPRDINVTHSNWGSDRETRRIIYESQRATDVSALNDWSLIRFWNREAKTFGLPYPAKGFIYRTVPTVPPSSIMTPAPDFANVLSNTLNGQF